MPAKAVQLVLPIPASAKTVAQGKFHLVCNDGKTAFQVPLDFLKEQSEMVRNLIDLDETEQSYVFPDEAATPSVIKAVAAWIIQHSHPSSPPRQYAVPLVSGRSLEQHMDDFDLQLITTHLCHGRGMFDHNDLYNFALVASQLQCVNMLRAATTFITFHIREGLKAGKDHKVLVSEWAGRTAPLTDEDIADSLQFMRDATKGVQVIAVNPPDWKPEA